MQILDYINIGKFVLWGIGRAGKSLLDSLNNLAIDAIIDSNKSLQGTSYNNIEIISLNTYLQKYPEHYIIISVQFYGAIVKELKSHQIERFFVLKDCPLECWNRYKKELSEHFPRPNSEDKIAIFGNNLFTLAVFCYWQTLGLKNIRLLQDTELSYSISSSTLKDFDLEDFAISKNELDHEYTVFYTNSGPHEKVKLKSQLPCALKDIFYTVSYDQGKYLSKLKKFKDIHKGDKCFIVATGASLTADDLNMLDRSGIISFGVNKIMDFFDRTNWRPHYYVAEDPVALASWDHLIDKADIPTKFIGDYYLAYWAKPRANNIHKFHVEMVDSGQEAATDFMFETDICKGIYCGWTVTAACLQIAAYMGFKQIYLLGVDCSYGMVNNSELHFNKNYHSTHAFSQAVADEMRMGMLRCYEQATQFAEDHTIKIFNATRGGYVEAFERVDFDTLFN